MLKALEQFKRNTWALTASIALALCVACGGGGNDERATVFINASVDDEGDFIEAEMLKDVTTNTATVTVSVGSAFDQNSIDNSVGTVRINRYELSYSRQDGGSPTPAAISGDADVSISLAGGTGLAQTDTFEAEVFRTSEKLFSDFALDFQSTFQPITLDASMRVTGTNLVGDTMSDTAGFRIQAAVFNPVDELLPVINSFNQVTELTAGENYQASWSVSSPVGITSGILVSPFFGQFFLDGGITNFPVGNITIPTTALVDTVTVETEFPSGILIVNNPFGFAQSNTNETVTVNPVPIPPPDPEPEPLGPLTITQFFADRTTIVRGESVTLTWAIDGGPTSVEIAPDTYSGVPVNLSGQDPAFGSVTITPEFSITPLLRAVRDAELDSDDAVVTAFLQEAITVTEPVDPPGPTAPGIAFFQASAATVQLGRPVTLFWEPTGDVASVELFPINNQRVDVTSVNAFTTPAFIDEGVFTFTLVVTGVDGSIVTSTLAVTVSSIFNQPIVIENVVQQPGTSIDNGDDASFSFTVNDPERRDSSWTVNKIAGDGVGFQPRSGQVIAGLGDASVSLIDFDDNENGFLTFEISAYDDPVFGSSRGSTRAVSLVTFETTGQLSDTAPVISSAEFISSGPDTAPGSTGVINFTFTDPDTLDLFWQVSIISGDFNGDLSPRSGRVTTGSGDISVQYEDDLDTPTDPVVFLIRVVEENVGDPQSDIFVLRVEKSASTTDGDGDGGGGDGGGDPTQPIVFASDAVYANLFGGNDPSDRVQNYTLYTNGSTANPELFRNSDLSGGILGASMVVDISHFSGDPSTITDVDFSRDFDDSANSNKNTGDLTFDAYYSSANEVGAGSATPVTNGVARWFMPFGVDAFLPDGGTIYNLPGLTQVIVYNITVTAQDDTNTQNLARTLVITAPNN